METVPSRGLQQHPSREQGNNGFVSGHRPGRGGALRGRAAHTMPLSPLCLPAWCFPQRGRQGFQPWLCSHAYEEPGGWDVLGL